MEFGEILHQKSVKNNYNMIVNHLEINCMSHKSYLFMFIVRVSGKLCLNGNFLTWLLNP